MLMLKSNLLSKHREKIKKLITYIVIPALALCAFHAFADNTEGVDLLQDTAKDLIKTTKDSAKVYIYIAELIISAVTFVKTRNPLVFAGVVVLAVGFNIVFKIAGV